jgi:YYY domain-containing protein
MGEAVVWWLTIELLGLIALPIAAASLRALPDRGYSAAKILGLLLVGWLAYTIAMIQIAPFGQILLLVCALLVAGFSIFLLLRRGRALLNDLRERFRTPAFIRYVIAAELLFTLLYAVWAVVRAHYPAIVDQEKFMDFGFLNSILKSGTFPPNDMWLAGFSINYYYFGYVLIAALTSLSGVPSQIAYNLANATLFALTALGSFGIAYNLIAGALLRRRSPARAKVAEDVRAEVPRRRVRATAQAEPVAAGSGAVTTAVPARRTRTIQSAAADGGNVAVVELSASPARTVSSDGNGRHDERSSGDGTSETGSMTPYEPENYGAKIENMPRVPFFLSPYIFAVLAALMVVAMGNLTTMFAVQQGGAESGGNGWQLCSPLPCQIGENYNWWAPSRIIRDYTTTQVPGQPPVKTASGIETINEFPAFSFLLADMHPHVLALPLVLLVITAAIALARRRLSSGTKWRDGIPTGLHGWVLIVMASLVVGSLYTTNTWDYPTYLLLMLGCVALPLIAAARRQERAGWRWLVPWIVQSALMIVLSLLAFLPFHLTFKSLVGGKIAQLPENVANIPVLGWVLQKLGAILLLNTADKTILGFLVIFGIFLLGLVVWLLYEFASHFRRRQRESETGTTTTTLYFFGVFLLVVFIAAFLFKFPLLALLLPMSVIALYLVSQGPGRIERNVALLMLALSALIGLTIEIVYLRDNFDGFRMNTLFKFYYQIWVMWALATAYAVWRTLHAAFSRADEPANARARAVAPPPSSHPAIRTAAATWAVVFGLLVLSGLMYSVYGPMSRQGVGRGQMQGLDGTTWFKDIAPGDYEAISWLKEHGTGDNIVLEAGSNEYDITGRASAYTGVPTLLSWDVSHEMLWRTNQPEALAAITERRRLVNNIYQGIDPANGGQLTPQRLVELLRRHEVDYVFVGATERGLRRDANNQRPDEVLSDYSEALIKQTLPEAFKSSLYNLSVPNRQATSVATTIYAVAGANVSPDAQPPVVPTATTTPQVGVDPNAPPRNLFETTGAGANRGQLNLPRGLAQDAEGNFYVVDTQNMRVQKYDRTGKWLLAFGQKGGEDGQFAAMNDDATGTGPGGIAVDSASNVYVADTWNHRIQKFDKDGKFLLRWGSYDNLSDPTAAGDELNRRFFGPRGVAVGPDGSVYVTDTGNKRVVIFDANGAYKRQISSGAGPDKVAPAYPFSQPGELNEPIGIAVDPSGNVYVADTNNIRIQKFGPDGKYLAHWPMPAGSWNPGPYLEPFLALDQGGNIYATAPTSKSVLKLSPTGELLGQKKEAGDALLDVPVGLTVSPEGEVYIVDTGASRVLRLGKIP